MKEYITFNCQQINKTHNALIGGGGRGATTIKEFLLIPLPKGIEQRHLIAYYTFAEACKDLMISMDYYTIRKMIVHVEGSIWKFKYSINTSLFFGRTKHYEFEWNEEAEKLLNELHPPQRSLGRRKRRSYR